MVEKHFVYCSCWGHKFQLSHVVRTAIKIIRSRYDSGILTGRHAL